MKISIKEGPKCDLTIVAISAEKPNAVARFIAAHLKQGAAKIVIYLDRGNADEVLQLAGKVPNLELISCDEAFWSETPRPDSLLDRQRVCYNHAYQNISTTWVGICDIDEVLVPKTSFAEELKKAEDNEQLIACPSWEAIWQTGEDCETIFSATHARRATQRLRQKRPEAGALFHVLSSYGLVGHSQGKYILRSGLPNAGLEVHIAKPSSENGEERFVTADAPGIRLLHFDAMSFESWNNKHQARFENGLDVPSRRSPRIAQTQIASLLTSIDSRRQFFEALYTVPPEQMKLALKQKRVKRISFDQNIIDFSDFILDQCTEVSPPKRSVGTLFSTLFRQSART